MPNSLRLDLSNSQQAALERLRDTHPKAYVRERTAALLKIAQGQSASEVARQGLLKRRQHQTICQWVQRYQREGIEGLLVRQGRGRKAAFSPSVRDETGGKGIFARGDAS